MKFEVGDKVAPMPSSVLIRKLPLGTVVDIHPSAADFIAGVHLGGNARVMTVMWKDGTIADGYLPEGLQKGVGVNRATSENIATAITAVVSSMTVREIMGPTDESLDVVPAIEKLLAEQDAEERK